MWVFHDLEGGRTVVGVVWAGMIDRAMLRSSSKQERGIACAQSVTSYQWFESAVERRMTVTTVRDLDAGML